MVVIVVVVVVMVVMLVIMALMLVMMATVMMVAMVIVVLIAIVVMVAGVHHKDEVKPIEVFLFDLARFLSGNFDAVPSHFFLGSRVGRFAVVVTVGSSGIHLDAKPFGLNVMSKHSLGHG